MTLFTLLHYIWLPFRYFFPKSTHREYINYIPLSFFLKGSTIHHNGLQIYHLESISVHKFKRKYKCLRAQKYLLYIWILLKFIEILHQWELFLFCFATRTALMLKSQRLYCLKTKLAMQRWIWGLLILTRCTNIFMQAFI